MPNVDDDFRPGGPTLLPEFDNFFRPLVRILDQSAIVRLIAIGAATFTLYSVYMTTLQVREDLVDRQEERLVRQEERIERAWSILRTPSSGNVGKGKALDFLLRTGHSMDTVDLSCSKVGEPEKAGVDYCPTPPVFTDFDLNPPEQQRGKGQIRQASAYRFYLLDGTPEEALTGGLKVIPDLSGVDLARFKGENLTYDVKLLRGTKIIEGELSESVFRGADPILIFDTSDLSYSHFTFDVISPVMRYSNVSGLTYKIEVSNAPLRNERLVYWMAGDNWAWADLPPMLIDDEGMATSPVRLLRELQLCDPSVRTNQETPEIAVHGYAVLNEAKGLSPQYNYPHRYGRCKQLSVEEAAARFPDRYPEIPSASELTD